MIEFKNVSKTYNQTLKAVDDLSLVVPDGKIVGFIGLNGAGKTTTLKMLTGILAPDNGSITINGFDIDKDAVEAKKQFAFVSDNSDVFLRLKGIEFLNFMGDIYEVPNEDRASRIQDLAKRFEMESALNDKIKGYSHGMRQKIMIMGALLHNPNVWILDEPLMGLDPRSSHELKEMMKEHVRRNNTVFFSTHVLDVAEKLCDLVAIINKGKILFCGTLEELKNKYSNISSLEDIFLAIINE